jgi:hypothetical protein
LGRRDKRVDVAWLVLAALIGVMPDALSGVLVGDSTVSKAGWTAAAQGRPRPSLGVAMPNYARRLLANSEPPSARRPHYYHLRLGTHPPLVVPVSVSAGQSASPLLDILNLSILHSTPSLSLSSSFEDFVSPLPQTLTSLLRHLLPPLPCDKGTYPDLGCLMSTQSLFLLFQ